MKNLRDLKWKVKKIDFLKNPKEIQKNTEPQSILGKLFSIRSVSDSSKFKSVLSQSIFKTFSASIIPDSLKLKNIIQKITSFDFSNWSFLYPKVHLKQSIQRLWFGAGVHFVSVLTILFLLMQTFAPILGPQKTEALNKVNNWAFATDATSWTSGNGASATDVCGSNTSKTETASSFESFGFDGTVGNPSGSFRARLNTATNATNRRGKITQTVTVPGSGTVQAKGRFDYYANAAGTQWNGTANTSWVRLDLYNSVDTTFVANLGCTSFNSNQPWTTTSFIGASLTGGATYTIRATFRARNPNTYGIIDLHIDNIILNFAPTGLAASAPAGTTNAQLNWTASTAGTGAPGLHATTPYKVYRNTSSPVTTGNFLANATTNSYTDTTTTGNTTYYYAVSDVDTNSVESPLSNEVSILTRPGTPGTPTFSNIAATSLRVNWTAPTGGAANYKVERAPDVSGAPGTFAEIASGVTALFYDDSGLSPNTSYWYRVRGTNSTGDGPYSSNAVVDKTAPVVSATGANPESWHTSNQTITLTATDTGGSGLSVARYSWNVALPADCLSGGSTYVDGNTIPFNTEGTHTLYLCGRDNDGNVGTFSDFYNLDKTAPTDPGTPTANATSPTNQTSVTWSWSAATDAVSGVYKYLYKLTRTIGATVNYWTGSVWTNTETWVDHLNLGDLSESFTGLVDTTYRFFVKAQDYAGNESSTVFSTELLVDTANPTIVNNQSGDDTWRNTNSGTYDVDFADTGGSQLSYFQTRVTTATGGGGSLIQDWTTVVSGINSNSYTANWALAASTFSAMQEGTNYVSVRVFDNATNSASANDVFYVKKDTISPVGEAIGGDTGIQIKGGAAETPITSVILTLNASDATSGVYQMMISNDGVFDTETWESYSTTKAWVLTAVDGVKTVYVKFRDNTLNESGAYSDNILLNSGSLNPTGSVLTENNAVYTTSQNVTLNLSAASNHPGFALTQMMISNYSNFNDVTWEPFSATKAVVLLSGDGIKTVYAKFRDSNGHESPTYNDTIILDTAAPTANTPTTTSSTNNIQPIWGWVASVDTNGVKQYHLTLKNSLGSILCTDTVTSTSWQVPFGCILLEGTYYLELRAEDNPGNTSAAATGSVIIDLTNPTDPGTPTATSPTNGQTPTWSWTASTDANGISGYYIKLGTTSGGSEVTSETSIGDVTSYIPGSNLFQGTYYLSVKARDNASRFSNYVTSRGLVLDLTAPTFSATYNPTLSVKAGNLTINITSSEALAAKPTVAVTQFGSSIFIIDSSNVSGSGTSWQATYTIVSGFDGLAEVDISGYDVAGNLGSAITSGDTFLVDTTAPVAPTVVSPTQNQIFTSDTITVTGDTEVGITAIVTVTVGGTEYTTTSGIDGSFTIPGVVLSSANLGYNTLYITARDLAGNTSLVTTRLVKLNAEPVVTVVSPNGGEKWTGTNIINWQATDGNNDILNYTLQYSPNNGAVWFPLASNVFTTTYSLNTATLADGANYKIKIFAFDGTALVADESNTVFAINDNLAVISLNSITMPTNNRTPGFTGTASSTSHNIVSVQFSIDGALWCNASPADGSFNSKTENYNFTARIGCSLALPDGNYLARTRFVDALGFYSSNTATFNFTIDTVAPGVPSVASHTSGQMIRGFSGTSVTISGNAEANSNITLTVGGTNYFGVTNAFGVYSIAGVILSHGSNSIQVRATDAAGNVSTPITPNLILNSLPSVALVSP